MTWMLAGSLATALSALLICLYYWHQGQFEGTEETKYQIFHEKEGE